MEGDGVPWGSEPESGPGPGGGGVIRELCRGFGRYRRYLGRLRQNLRDTQKFFRDLRGSQPRGCPSSPAEGGEAGRIKKVTWYSKSEMSENSLIQSSSPNCWEGRSHAASSGMRRGQVATSLSSQQSH